MIKEKICGTCRWHRPYRLKLLRPVGMRNDRECLNLGSTSFATVTQPNDTCVSWEGRV